MNTVAVGNTLCEMDSTALRLFEELVKEREALREEVSNVRTELDAMIADFQDRLAGAFTDIGALVLERDAAVARAEISEASAAMMRAHDGLIKADRNKLQSIVDEQRVDSERLREQVAVLRVALLAQRATDDLYYSTYAISVSDTAWRDYSEAKEFAKAKMDAALETTK